MIPSAGQLIITCAVNQYSGAVAIADVDFNCTDTPSANNEIKLIVGLGDGESHIRDESGVRHTDGTYERSVFVDCIVPQQADMHLEIKGGDATCDSLPSALSCTVPPGGSFILGIATNNPPPQGYYQFTTEVLYGGLKYNPAPDDPYTPGNEGVAYEVVWPAGGYDLYGVRIPYPPNGTEGYIQHGVAGPVSHYVGNLVNLSMSCQQPGSFPVTLTSYDYPERPYGSEFFAVRSGANDYNAVRLNREDTIDIVCLAPPTSTPTITPTATPTRTRVPPELGGVAERPDAASGADFGLWAGVAAAAGLLVLGAGGLALRRRRLP